MTESPNIYEEREALTYKAGDKIATRYFVAKEMPLTIVLNGEKLATLVCSPHSLELLTIGYLMSEGILQHHDQLKNIFFQPEQNTVQVDCTVPMKVKLYEQIQSVVHQSTFTVKELLRYSALLDEMSETFRLTGGVHEAALAHKGSLIATYEDIGRHNALDRILGYTLLNQINASDKAVVLSGRIASEMLIKAARIGVPIIVSRSAPTCSSIDLAEQWGITLVGFARGDILSVYTHPDRVTE